MSSISIWVLDELYEERDRIEAEMEPRAGRQDELLVQRRLVVQLEWVNEEIRRVERRLANLHYED